MEIIDIEKSEGEKSEGTGKTNKLIAEKSPYLLQHAHNPVDWYAWGEEAFIAGWAFIMPIMACHPE